MLCVQGVLHRLRRARIRDEALVWRQRRMVPLADQRAVPLLLGEPEGRLEVVHEQAHGLVEMRKGFGCLQAFEAPISDHASHHGAILLFDMGLIVLAIGPCARELHA